MGGRDDGSLARLSVGREAIARPGVHMTSSGPAIVTKAKGEGIRVIVEVVKLEPLIVHEDQLLRVDRVHQLTGLSRSSIYELAGDGHFPCPVQLTGKAVAWRAREVLDWIKARPSVVVRQRSV